MKLEFIKRIVPNPNAEEEKAKKEEFLTLANEVYELLGTRVDDQTAYQYLTDDGKKAVAAFLSIVNDVQKYDVETITVELDDETKATIQQTFDRLAAAVEELKFMTGLPPIE